MNEDENIAEKSKSNEVMKKIEEEEEKVNIADKSRRGESNA